MEEDSEAATLVHNYGHAGAGVIMSWGSAVECADIVDRVVHKYGHAGAGVTMSWGSAGESADIVARV